MGWYKKQKAKIEEKYGKVEAEAKAIFQSIPKHENRKDYAFLFLEHDGIASILFKMLDGQSYSDLIWKIVKPNAHEVFRVDEA